MKTDFSKRLFGALIAIIMVVSMVPNGIHKASAIATPSQRDYETGDLFAFGSYPQTKVTDTALILVLESQPLQADNTVAFYGSKYLKQTDWFKFEPLQWRILSNTNGELFVMSDKILATRPYNQEYVGITWETCTMRYWLNNEFFNTAYTAKEQAKIKTSTVINENNPWNGTSGGNNTSDKLFLLSYAEAVNPAYGFFASLSSDTARVAQGTDYAKSQGLYVNGESSFWWLRSPGGSSDKACDISYSGKVFFNSYTVDDSSIGVRPAFKINQPSDIFTSKAGSNCMIDWLDYLVYGLTPGITSLDDYVDVATGHDLAFVLTNNGFGTGTIVNVTLSGAIVESYTIIIYGDVNGDGSIDSIDAGTMVDLENYMVTWDPVTESAYSKAGDLNDDGSIDSIDAGLVVDAENYMMYINQSTGLALTPTPIEGTVTIGGIAKYGNTLTADTTNISPSNATLVYLWKRGGVEVGTDKTYVITTADIGKSVTVTVTGVEAYAGGIRSLAVTPTKLDTAIPIAPALSSKTPNSITCNAIAGQEYKIEGGEWQASAVFTGLSSNTAYIFYTRVAETDTHNPSGVSAPLSVTTYEKDLSGTVIITGVAQYGATLTANIAGVMPNSATLAYQWKRGEEVIGIAQTYNITVDDIGQPLTVTVMGMGDYFGSITSTAVYPTTKAIGGTVTITGTAIFGGILTGKISSVTPSGASLDYQWKRGEVIIGNGLTYTITVDDIGQSLTFVVTGIGGYVGSITSAGVIPTKANVAIPATPTQQSVTSSSVTLNAVAGQEYRVNSGTWQSSAVFTGLNKNTAYSFYTRVAETATHNASAVSTALSITTSKVTITGAVLITGNASVGQTLTADISGIIPNDATLSYIWKAGNIQISTGSSYTVLDADIGESITVTVTGIGDYLGSIKSAAKVITS